MSIGRLPVCNTNCGTKSKLRAGLFVVAVSVLTLGCDRSQLSDTSGTRTSHIKTSSTDLAIIGYNYTDREIGRFTVNGIGGGNIAPSTDLGGGGGITCCARFRGDGKPNRYIVRWDAASCRFNEKVRPKTNESFELAYSFKEQTVTSSYSGIGKPNYLEVHFFGDGTIKTMITSDFSAPLHPWPQGFQAKLSPQCPGNVAPAEAD